MERRLWKQQGEKGQSCRIPPACLSAQRSPETLGGGKRTALYPVKDCSGILVRFRGVTPTPPPSSLDNAPSLHRSPPPRDFIHCCCCIQHLIKSARKNTHNGGQQLSDALWGVQFAWGVLSHTVKAGRIVMWRPWKTKQKKQRLSPSKALN